MAVKRWQYRLRFVHPAAFLHELVVFAVIVQGCFAHHAAPFDAPVILGNRERIFFSNFDDADAFDVLPIRDREVRIRRGAQKIRVESGFFSDRSGLLAAVTERNRNRIVGVTRRNVSRNHQFAFNRLVVRVFGEIVD